MKKKQSQNRLVRNIRTIALSLSLTVVTLLSGCTSAAKDTTSASTTTPEVDNSSFMSIMTTSNTDWYFTKDVIPNEDLETILQAAANTPSASNEQPWHFTVITDPEILEEIAADAGDIGLGIMISVPNSNEMKIVDAGLSCMNMYITSKALGYAAKIETSPARVCRNDTDRYNEILGIDDSMSARAFLIVGYAAEDGADTVTHATEANPISVTYVE